MLKKKQMLQNGGDGYVVNVNEAIGGLPAYSRYSNNYKPVFEGDLLQNGGSEKTANCGCGNKDLSVFDLIKQSGGNGSNKLTQFDAIKEVSTLLEPFETDKLLSLSTNIFLKHYSNKRPRIAKQLGGYVNQLQSILAPLGKNNLLVLSGLLLLHYFAVEKENNTNGSYQMNKQLVGGDTFMGTLSNILESSGILVLLQQGFDDTQNKKKFSGGNPLKNLIAPLGTSAFIATGLLIIIERLFIAKYKEIKMQNGGLHKNLSNTPKTSKKNYEKLFNLIAPITFNTFAKESFLTKMAEKKYNH